MKFKLDENLPQDLACLGHDASSVWFALGFDRGQGRAAPGGQPGAVPTYILSLYEFLALFLIQMGVPTNPNASRIWFSKKR
jgi:hypothetical protein